MNALSTVETWSFRIHSFRLPGVPRHSLCLTTLGPHGAELVHPLGLLSPFEAASLEQLLPELRANIQTGVDFVRNQPPVQ